MQSFKTLSDNLNFSDLGVGYSSSWYQIEEFTPFQARKGGSGPVRPKGPELGVVIMNLLRTSVLLFVIRKY